MTFTIDKQTLDDLNILGKYKGNSVYNLFSHTVTRGGERWLEELFLHPLTDTGAINRRAELFEYFSRQSFAFPFEQKLFEEVEFYLSNAGHPNRIIAWMNTCRRKFLSRVALDKEFETLSAGLLAGIEFLNILRNFVQQMDHTSVYGPELSEIEAMLADTRLTRILAFRKAGRLSLVQFARFDYWMRGACYPQFRHLLRMLYALDVYITVGRVARERGFHRAKAYPVKNGKSCISLKQVSHPCLPDGIANDMEVDEEHNVIFLTGANMAGKSTLMKAFAIAVYLAHIGFPVAAEKMEFTLRDGLYTSINVPDNLNRGYSHFYAEVLRVRQVAEDVASGKNLVVIFDELFKGTNVKDAYDATVAVTAAFSEYRNCSFIISTHITEAGHTLRERCPDFRFIYLPTLMKGVVPTYTYRLQEGITSDRHGMMIIRNEHILEIIRGEEKANG